jgi:hypothetical protein
VRLKAKANTAPKKIARTAAVFHDESATQRNGSRLDGGPIDRSSPQPGWFTYLLTPLPIASTLKSISL